MLVPFSGEASVPMSHTRRPKWDRLPGQAAGEGGGVVLVPMGSAQLPALPSQLLLEELLSESQAQYFKSANIFS